MHYEDEKCLIIDEPKKPVAQVHFLVILKERCVQGLSEVDPAVMGKLMIKASEIAKELGLAENGYRIVLDQSRNGKHTAATLANLLFHIIGGQQLYWPPLGQ